MLANRASKRERESMYVRVSTRVQAYANKIAQQTLRCVTVFALALLLRFQSLIVQAAPLHEHALEALVVCTIRDCGAKAA